MLAGQAFEWLTVITLQSPSFLVVIGKSVGREWFAPRLFGRQRRRRRDARNDITWCQADDKAVGVAENDRVIDRQVGR